jgi:acyl-CoA thioesterase-1
MSSRIVSIRPPDGSCRPTPFSESTASLILSSLTQILPTRYNRAMAPIISRPAVYCLIFVSIVAAVGCGPPSTEETTQPVVPLPTANTDTPRVVFFGDSLSAGLGLAENEAFPAVTGELLRAAGVEIEVVNAGVSGDTSAGGLARLDWVLGQGADVLVVELGGNDGLRGWSLENTESNLRRIVQRGRDIGASVLLLGMDIPTNYGPDYTTAFAEMYRKIADDEGATLVPGFIREVGMDPSLMQPDGIHPTAEGHRRLAETLRPYLEDTLSDLSDSGTS